MNVYLSFVMLVEDSGIYLLNAQCPLASLFMELMVQSLKQNPFLLIEWSYCGPLEALWSLRRRLGSVLKL